MLSRRPAVAQSPPLAPHAMSNGSRLGANALSLQPMLRTCLYPSCQSMQLLWRVSIPVPSRCTLSALEFSDQPHP
eukprot:6558401-Prymnesium_polylepis.1